MGAGHKFARARAPRDSASKPNSCDLRLPTPQALLENPSGPAGSRTPDSSMPWTRVTAIPQARSTISEFLLNRGRANTKSEVLL